MTTIQTQRRKANDPPAQSLSATTHYVTQAPSDSKEDLHLIILLSNLAGKVGENRQLRQPLFVKQSCTERETVVYTQDFTVRKSLKALKVAK